MIEGDSQPLVSIITVSYNSGKHIERTILSVLSQYQCYPRIEYIIIDGASTDNSIEILKKYEQYLAYWVSEPDSGISEAFNKGILASRGEIIGIINAGDSYTDGSVAEAVKTLSENPDRDFVYGDLIYADEQGKTLFLMRADRHYEKKIRFTMPALNHPTLFVKRDVYMAEGLFDLQYKIAMDYEFLLRITLAGRKGICAHKALAIMIIGGISLLNFYRGYEEVCKASIHYGYPVWKAHVRLYLKGMRGLSRILMERLRLDFLARIIRKIFWRVKDGEVL